MLNSKPLIATLSLAVVVASAFLLLSGPQRISQWEKSHDYPFGRMCHSIFTLYENTCDLRKRR